MNSNEAKTLTRDVEAAVVPVGTKVTLQKGGQAYVMQSLGGSLHRRRQRQHVPH